jgi:uncharacterized membrane protein
LVVLCCFAGFTGLIYIYIYIFNIYFLSKYKATEKQQQKPKDKKKGKQKEEAVRGAKSTHIGSCIFQSKIANQNSLYLV